MEIHSLRVSISESDLNDLAGKHLPDDQPIEDLRFVIAPDGVHIKGVYPLFVNVSFDTHWELAARGGKLTARLAGFRAMGIPGNIFKSAILQFVADAARKEDWLEVQQDTLVADIDRLLGQSGMSARTNFCAVVCQAGVILLESAGGS